MEARGERSCMTHVRGWYLVPSSSLSRSCLIGGAYRIELAIRLTGNKYFHQSCFRCSRDITIRLSRGTGASPPTVLLGRWGWIIIGGQDAVLLVRGRCQPQRPASYDNNGDMG